jgi:hypothetical protein
MGGKLAGVAAGAAVAAGAGISVAAAAAGCVVGCVAGAAVVAGAPQLTTNKLNIVMLTANNPSLYFISASFRRFISKSSYYKTSCNHQQHFQAPTPFNSRIFGQSGHTVGKVNWPKIKIHHRGKAALVMDFYSESSRTCCM